MASDSDSNNSESLETIIKGTYNRRILLAPNPSFDTTNIFKIDQCINTTARPTASDASLSTVAGVPIDSPDDGSQLNIFNFERLTEVDALSDVIALPIELPYLKCLAFTEQLIVSYKYGDETLDMGTVTDRRFKMYKNEVLPSLDVLESLGGCTISINLIEGADSRTYCDINSYSQFSFSPHMGAACTLTSKVDAELNLIEEQRIETLTSKDSIVEKGLQIRCQQVDGGNASALMAKKHELKDRHLKELEGRIPDRVMGRFLQDGGVYLLMRYLVLQKYVGKFKTFFMTIAGDLCPSKFCCTTKEKVKIFGTPCPLIYIIKRSIYQVDCETDISYTGFLPNGRMLFHQWCDCTYLWHLNPLKVDVLMQTPVGDLPLNAAEANGERWREDVGLYGKYVQMKLDRQVEIRSFMRNRPQVMALIRDYIYCLLRSKPDNVLDYSIKHFTSFKDDGSKSQQVQFI